MRTLLLGVRPQIERVLIAAGDNAAVDEIVARLGADLEQGYAIELTKQFRSRG